MSPPNDSEAFTMICATHRDNVFGDYEEQYSAKTADPDLAITASIRHHHPDKTLTVTPVRTANLLSFAAAGHAQVELETSDDPVLRWRVYQPAAARGNPGYLSDIIFFAKYRYVWNNLTFILYFAQVGLNTLNYILFPPDDDETTLSNSKATDALLAAVGAEQYNTEGTILVYDSDIYNNGYWQNNRDLYKEVQRTSWDDVILNASMKKAVSRTVLEFFDSKAQYRNLGVPWKRGLIFHGPAGNGKTISLKAIMHSLIDRRGEPIVPLYVKSMKYNFQMREVFQKARQQSPCLLILEDVDTLVTADLRSYFFNEIDGLENNSGIMIIATTNHLDELDPGLSKRPSRFDRKYKFPLPSREERVLYCEFWRRKLKGNEEVEFPEKLCGKIADITGEFSFAYMKEAFVASLLALARREDDDDDDEDEDGQGTDIVEDEDHVDGRMKDDDGAIEDLALWKEMVKQVRILREDMDSGT